MAEISGITDSRRSKSSREVREFTDVPVRAELAPRTVRVERHVEVERESG